MSTTILTLEHEGASVALRLEPDPDRRYRALVHGVGHALSHAGSLPVALRALVLDAAERFESDAPGSTDDAITRLRSAIADLAPGARLSVVVEVTGARGMPRWSSALRTGAPRLDGGGIWPFDAELAGLRLGTRRIVKRECATDASAAADRAWLERNAVHVRAAGQPDSGGRRVLFGALDAGLLGRDLDDAERALREGRDADSIRWLGDALGYPACCVDAFIGAGAQDDLSLVATMLGPLPRPAAPPQSQWLNQPLAIVSHVPCSLECAMTIDLATALVGELERAHVGFASAWTRLAARVHVLTGSGTLAAGFEVDGGVELHVSDYDDLSGLLTDASDVVGRTLRVVDGVLTDGAGLDAVAAADHTRI